MFCSLVSAVAAVDDVDLDALSDAELCEAVEVLERVASMVEARRSLVVGAWDARRCWQASGARNGAAWLAATCRVPAQDARRQVRTARQVRDLPVTEAAWAAGEIGSAHVHRLLRARNGRTAEALARDEAELVAVAKTGSFRVFDRAVANWSDRVDPDGCDEDAEARRARRRVHLSESLDGMWFGDLVLDPVTGTIVSDELRRIEAEFFAQDRAEAGERLGVEEPAVHDLWRTPAQRRADALAEMAARSGRAAADGRKPAPLFTVLVGFETFAGRICELGSGTPVEPALLRPWLEHADVQRVVFGAPGHVVEVSEQRCFTGLLRRAVQVRDRECYHPMCELPAEWCEVDHVQPAGWGGPTSQANGRPACGFHNRLRNKTTGKTNGARTEAGADPP